MGFVFSERSRKNLEGVHPDLVTIATVALTISPVDFVVIEGVRTLQRQQKLVEAGASWTMNSRHLTGHAIDLAAWVDGEIRWDWPLYRKIANAMLNAAGGLNIPLVWGGSWKAKDGPHFELDRKAYP